MRHPEETKKHIYDGTIELINEVGVKFTMDQLSQRLAMSKKTIYVAFPDKGVLFYNLVDYIFDQTKAEQQKVLEDPNLSTVEKLKAILSTVPDDYIDLGNLNQLYKIKNKFPKAYQHLLERLEGEWDPTIALIEKGIQEGVFRNVNPVTFQLTYEAAAERFLFGTEMEVIRISYQKMLKDMADILVEGIIKRD